MTKYKALLFDVDNTLLDFNAAEQVALKLLFEGENLQLTPEVEAQYKKINSGLWKSFEEGKIDQDEVVNTRFSKFFKEYGKEVDGVLFETNYRSFLSEGSQLMEGALELINKLHAEYDLYIVTNGVAETQYKRLKKAGLDSLFKGVFISQEVGYQKPRKEFFDHVLANIPNVSTNQLLIIGDSLSADIKGGNMAGIDTCWFNPERKQNSTDIEPTYEIHKLTDLYPILETK
ncbi:YjjG family noncanonical pyrimidine nucleotidase [Caldibacillus lycopersici]|uniref:YjjG family noncanonical pyrimidine nucleotidase n=1 Tax=Perspicuibacillus lycopersici TaxID=1325689 RepID=A0AAE3IRH3_9BACI|nr:YjjG family noncanonical pyrimidine nucleotidase [Perspicuibacillus lycopersici]MCU9613250.1 YjjG family noncanonical pyrimidine nucleotidase [Perspicuibacillus lycopersici]